MATVIVKTNAGQATDVLIADCGIYVPNSGGSETFIEFDEILVLQQSQNLAAYLVDNAFGAGSSTLILNDGTSDIAQADATNWLNQTLLAAGGANFGVLKSDLTGTFQAGGEKITNLGTPTVATDATTKQYVDDAVTQGRTWREAILTNTQLLNGASGAVRQAIAFYLDGQPSNNDTFIITDGATTETFTFKTVAGPAFQVLIGANADATMLNLSTQISTDSTLWDAVRETTLNSINDGSGTSTSGMVVVIYRTAQTVTTYADRIRGVLTTAAFGQYINFNGQLDYTRTTSSVLPSVDPAVKTFGFGRIKADLISGETHLSLANDSAYTWDEDTDTWNLTGAGTQFGTSIQPLGAAISAGTGSLAARDNHVHTHGDRGGDPAGSEHDADQVDVEGTYAAIGAPASAETVFANINANFINSKYVGKQIPLSVSSSVPGAGTRFLKYGEVFTSTTGVRMNRAGTITGASIQVEVVDATRAYKLSIQVNGVEVALLALPVSTLGASTVALAVAFVLGDRISAAIIRTSGAGTSSFNDVTAYIEYNNA